MATSAPNAKFRLGVDIGGTKIEVMAIDAEGHERWRRRAATPRGDYDATLAGVRALVHAAEAELGGRGTVGVAQPGSISPSTGLVRNGNSTWLNGRPLQVDLQRLLDRPVRTANDANCFALSEATDGAATGARCVLGVILGTGVGGGIVVDGRLLDGRNMIGGEWGHNPLPWQTAAEYPGPPCWCGKIGCIEQFLSGPAFEADYARDTGQTLKAPAIVELAETGNAKARAALGRYENRLARALATMVNVIDPDIIVLGGGMSNVRRLYVNVPVLMPDFIFADTAAITLVPPKHGDSSGVRGAAWLWPPETAG
ncbi:MAG: ROK family protein [Alphaproteobacteria bacterium]